MSACACVHACMCRYVRTYVLVPCTDPVVAVGPGPFHPLKNVN